MHIESFPTETQQAEYGETVDGFRLNETTLVPRAYANHEASAVQRAYALQTGRIDAANKAAVWNGNLSKNLMCKLFFHSPPVSKPP